MIKVRQDNFEKEVLQSDIPVLVDFWATWCAPCRMIEPHVEEIAKQYEGKIKVCKLNVDENPDLTAKIEVVSIPTLIIFKNGKEIKRIVGALPKRTIEQYIKDFALD